MYPQAPARPSLLSQGRLTYIKTILELALLLFALPWVIRELFTDPVEGSRKLAGAHKPMAS